MLNDAIVVEQCADAGWYIRLHVMANSLEALEPHRTVVPAWGSSYIVPDPMRIYHLRVYWPIRGPIYLTVPLGLWPMVAWWIGDDKVSKAIIDGTESFKLAFGLDPMFAFIRAIPARAQEFVEVHGVVLVQAEWVPYGFVAIARGGMQVLKNGDRQ